MCRNTLSILLLGITELGEPGYFSRYSDFATGWTTEGSVFEGHEIILFARTGSGAHSASYTIGTGAVSPGKAAGAWSCSLMSM
jgi:hypothetical protein